MNFKSLFKNIYSTIMKARILVLITVIHVIEIFLPSSIVIAKEQTWVDRLALGIVGVGGKVGARS